MAITKEVIMKRIQRIATVILSAALIMLNTEPVMAVSKIYNIIEHDELTIDEGKKCSLALPTKYKIVKWTSSNSNVAKVSKSGKLTAVNGGYATITAKTKDFNFKCYVTVNENYSEWTVRYSTDDLLDLLDNIADGYVAKINGEYYCSPEYVEMLKNTKTTVTNLFPML
jgi:hypothetical protein